MAALQTSILHLHQHGAKKVGAGQASPHCPDNAAYTSPEEFGCRVKK